MNWGLVLYIDLIVFVFGAVVGSFLNVCIYRMPRELSVVKPRSACPNCGNLIAWRDNIPILSYLLLRGKCRHCQTSITPRYMLVELMTGLLFLAVWLKLTIPAGTDLMAAPLGMAPIYWLLLAGLIVSTFIDFEHFIIPNEITYGGIIAGFVLAAIYPTMMETGSRLSAMGLSAAGILVGGGTLWAVVEVGKLAFGKLKIPLPEASIVRIADGKLFVLDEEHPWEEMFYRDSDRIRFRAGTLKFGERAFENVDVSISETTMQIGEEQFALDGTGPIEATTDLVIVPREAMGFGDVKFMAAIGAFLGWKATLFSVFVSSVTGGVVGLVLMALGKKDLQSRIPYGPYIALGALLWILAGHEIVSWYKDLIQLPRG